MEASTTTNTGQKGLEYGIANALAQAVRAFGIGGSASRASATKLSGQTVLAGALIVSVAVPAKASKVKVAWFASWQAGAGNVTPLLQLVPGSGPTLPVAAYAQRTTNTVESIGGETEVDGLDPTQLYTLQFKTTVADRTITLGQGVSAPGAGVFVDLVP